MVLRLVLNLRWEDGVRASIEPALMVLRLVLNMCWEDGVKASVEPALGWC